MKQDLDNVFEKIIEGEARRYTVLQVGEKIERHPSHFKGMKEMYQKEWNSLLNPNEEEDLKKITIGTQFLD